MSIRTILGVTLGVVCDPGASRSDRLRATRFVATLVADGPVDESALADVLDAADRCADDDEVCAALRRATEAAVRAFGDLPPSAAIAARLGRCAAAAPAHGARPASDVLRSHFTAICVATEKSRMLLGVATGVLGLDVFASGLRRGGLYVLVGADDLALDLALHVAVNIAADEAGAAEGDIVVRSTAATAERLATRMLCAEAHIAETKLWLGRLTSEEWSRLTNSASYVSTLPIFFADARRPRGSASTDDPPAKPDVASLRLLVEDEPSPERLAELLALAEGDAGGGAMLVSLRSLPRGLVPLADTVWTLRRDGTDGAELRVIANRHGPKGRSLLVYDAASGAVSEPEVAEER